MLRWVNHKVESKLLGEISIISGRQMIPPLWQKFKSLLIKLKEESEKAGLKLNIPKTRIMASGPIILWNDRIYFLWPPNHCGWWLQPWNKKMFAPWKKSNDKPRQHIKKQRHYFTTNVCLVKDMIFPEVMYGCESWTIMKTEHWRIDVFKLWFWRRLLKVFWTLRRLNQSILKEIKPDCSLEGLMLKLMLQ